MQCETAFLHNYKVTLLTAHLHACNFWLELKIKVYVKIEKNVPQQNIGQYDKMTLDCFNPCKGIHMPKWMIVELGFELATPGSPVRHAIKYSMEPNTAPSA